MYGVCCKVQILCTTMMYVRGKYISQSVSLTKNRTQGECGANCMSNGLPTLGRVVGRLALEAPLEFGPAARTHSDH